MEFDKAYNREDFLSFLGQFLPDDFLQSSSELYINPNMKYTTSALKLGICKSLDLEVIEIRHLSHNDARVSLSKEAFHILANENLERALVLFIPDDTNVNYRFSFIEITIESKENSSKLNIKYSNPHRYSYFLGQDISYHTPNKYLNELGKVKDIKDLRSRFSVEILTKEFYQELSDWYAWAIKIIRFPNDIDDEKDDNKYNNESAIRLITRLIFVWFLKQRHLIPDEFFDEEYISNNLLEDFNPHVYVDLFSKSNESKYYKAILQNLFFAMLNSPITNENKDALSERRFRKGREDYDNNKVMRYEKYFKNPKLFIAIANSKVPFLNGGLFDCLDDKDNKIYYDGFSDREVISNSLIVPDYLFFGEEVGRNIDLSEWYGDEKKKKVSARGIIDILKRYNFTVEENTPFDKDVSLDPELLGKVFENLLASFNPETKTSARNQTGSFFTPREVVQYMVDESLIEHLKHTLGENYESKIRELLQYKDDEVALTEEEKKKIVESIYSCKILDPACGSGAFPMGVLQQMVHILNRIDPDNVYWKKMMRDNAISETSEAYMNADSEERRQMVIDIEDSFNDKINRPDYARKLYLIENCIYGVDIQPIAIQISKLRFFISLVVDQKINNNPIDNFGIRPLPNLEAKFVAADTLIGLKQHEMNLFANGKIKEKEEQLKIAKHKIFGAKTVRTKRKYKAIVNELRIVISNMLKESGVIGNEEAEQLSEWDMFDQNSKSPFFDSDWMFNVANGFDIVLGNPPYIQLQNENGKLANKYEKCGYNTFKRTGDIYSLFYERGWQLLKNDGDLCFITSNKWMRAAYGENTRDFFSKNTNPILLIDFGGVKVFDGVTVDTNILLFSKSKNLHNTICCSTGKQDKECITNLHDFVKNNNMICDFHTKASWIILSPIELSIKKKIEAVGKPLKDWNVKIYRGILTGCNEAFIINKEKRNEILANCKTEDERRRTDEIIRPILRGRDIRRYGYEWAGLYLINTHNGIKGVKPKVEIDDYPSIKAHLDKYWNLISVRTDQGDTPYNLRNCAYMDDFNKQVISWQRITSMNQFCLSKSGLIILDSMAFISNIDRYKYYLLAVLNSDIIYYWISTNVHEYGKSGFRLANQYVEQIPIPFIPAESQIQYISIVKSLLSSPSKKNELLLNDMIYNLYKLSEDEIQHIRKKTI